ncbi:hypothetical protein D3C80_1376840 [compost metagenome]
MGCKQLSISGCFRCAYILQCQYGRIAAVQLRIDCRIFKPFVNLSGLDVKSNEPACTLPRHFLCLKTAHGYFCDRYLQTKLTCHCCRQKHSLYTLLLQSV